MGLATRENDMSRFGRIYSADLKAWADELQKASGLIVAIARKGPRLIEAMIKDGFLPSGFLERVTSNKALPFIRDIEGGLVIADDAIIYGSTFLKEFNIAQQVSGKPANVICLPFAFCDEFSSSEAKSVVERNGYSYSLNGDEIPSFVNNQVQSFYHLGKPYDLEYPILSISGDFLNLEDLEGALDRTAKKTNGILIPVHGVDFDGRIRYSWTILFDSEVYVPGRTPDLCKLRIYLDQNFEQLRISAMSPYAFSKSTLLNLDEHLPRPLGLAWGKVREVIDEDAEGSLLKAMWLGLVTWANYLAALPLLKQSARTLLTELGESYVWDGPTTYDLQLLVGPRIAGQVEGWLHNYLDADSNNGFDDHVEFPPCTIEIPDEHVSEEIPQECVINYFRLRTEELKLATDIRDSLEAVFFAQHVELEIATRDKDVDLNSRLDFGVTMRGLQKIVSEALGEPVSLRLFHFWFDTLIDRGSVVPKYINIRSHGSEPVWVRSFRVGESDPRDYVHRIVYLFSVLSEVMQTEALERELFEKYSVLALFDSGDKELRPLRLKEFEKGYHLYGARPKVKLGQRSQFLMDWARYRSRIFRDQGSKYVLDEEKVKRFPLPVNNPVDIYVQQAAEQLAIWTKRIHDQLGLDALVTITSVATPREFQRSLEAELELWLHHGRNSIHQSLDFLGDLASKAENGEQIDHLLTKANDVISETANYTAQTKYKCDLYSNSSSTLKSIKDLSEGDRELKWTWRKIESSLRQRARREHAAYHEEIRSVLRVVHQTNNLVRDILTLAGFTDNRSQPVESRLFDLLQILNDPQKLHPVTRAVFVDLSSSENLVAMIEHALQILPDNFPNTFRILHPIIMEIASRCERVYSTFCVEDPEVVERYIETPFFLLMWDIRDSTKVEDRIELSRVIRRANRQIRAVLGDNAIDFDETSLDDGNHLMCEKYENILAVFAILDQIYRVENVRYANDEPLVFRAGCVLSTAGGLVYYPDMDTRAGRAYEFAARMMNMFKEISNDNAAWISDPATEDDGTPRLPNEPKASYLVLDEAVYRHAVEDESWSIPREMRLEHPSGSYISRVHGARMRSIYLLISEEG